MTNYKWHPIAPLSPADKAIDLSATRALYGIWQTSEKRLQKSSAANLKKFTDQLVRRLSVETGILERLYDLDRGTTEALVANGFVEDLVSRSNTDIDPSRLIDILRDHEAAIQLVMDCVSANRGLTKSVVHELHAILTRNQSTTTAIDAFGKRLEIPLLRGKFKEHPNNPRRPDGSLHEYCPPVQVESEMDSLLGLLEGYRAEDPVLVTAWFHHRFTQIHPYQDGNGRVARALTTLILLRAHLLPLIIDRDLRVEYISSLEAADAGELAPLATLFARLERGAILQALSVDADAQIAHERTVTAAVLDSLKDKFGKRREAKHAELRRVNNVARQIRGKTRKMLEAIFNELGRTISQIAAPDISITEGGPDRDNSHWYKYEVVQSANETGKYANFHEDHYFLRASIRADRERLLFVVSFHHVGRELSGIMEATAFARFESFEDSDDRKSVSKEFFLCSNEPFIFTYQTKESDFEESYESWLDRAVAIAVKEYGDRL